jgi:hypothetical protein
MNRSNLDNTRIAMGSFVKKKTCTFAKISGTAKLNTNYLECRLKLSIFMLNMHRSLHIRSVI